MAVGASVATTVTLSAARRLRALGLWRTCSSKPLSVRMRPTDEYCADMQIRPMYWPLLREQKSDMRAVAVNSSAGVFCKSMLGTSHRLATLPSRGRLKVNRR